MKKEHNLLETWFLFFSRNPIWHTFLLSIMTCITLFLLRVPLSNIWAFFYALITFHLCLVYSLISRRITRPAKRRVFSKPKEYDQYRISYGIEAGFLEIRRPIWDKPKTFLIRIISVGLQGFSTIMYFETISGTTVTIPIKIKLEIQSSPYYREEIARMLWSRNERLAIHCYGEHDVFDLRADWFFSKILLNFQKTRNSELINLCSSYVNGKIEESKLQEKLVEMLSLKECLLPNMSNVSIVFEKPILIQKKRSFPV